MHGTRSSRKGEGDEQREGGAVVLAVKERIGVLVSGHSNPIALGFTLRCRIYYSPCFYNFWSGWMWVQLRWRREMHTHRCCLDGAARGFLGALLERFPESQGYAAFLSRSHQRNRTSCFLLVGRVDRVSGPDPSTELSFERSAMLPSSEKAAHSLDSFQGMWARNAACHA